jgi:hypothetical protein
MKPKFINQEHWREYLQRQQNGADEMTLEQFLSHWQVSRQDLAIVCECSIDTVNHWFSEGSSHREPNRHHKRRLGLAHRELLRITRSSSPSRQVYNNVLHRS